jgi:hypothetical protein
MDQPLNQRLREIREAHHDPGGEPAPESPTELPRHAPLGRLLVEKGLLSEAVLGQALERQRESGRPLGQILVELGEISPQNLARTLTEQHGFDLTGSLRARLAPSDSPEAADDETRDETYLVRETSDGEPLHAASTFLDAADVAFELIEDRDPEQLEIVRGRGGEFEHVWSYRRAEEPAAPPLYPS